MKKEPPKKPNEVPDFFRFFYKLRPRYPKHALLVVRITHEYVLFNEDAEVVAKLGRERLHQKRDGVLYADLPRCFERYRSDLEAAGHRLVYVEEDQDGFHVKNSPAGWLEAPAPLWEDNLEWALLANMPRPKRKKTKPQYVQRTLDFE